MPGLWDAHVHLTQWALARRRLDVSGATSAAHAVALVAAAPRAAARGRPWSASGSATGSGPTCRRPRCSTPPSGTGPSSWSPGTCTAPGRRRPGCASSASGRTPPACCARPSGSRCRRVVDHVPDDVADGLVDDACAAAAARGVVGVVDLELADNVAVWRRRVATAALAAARPGRRVGGVPRPGGPRGPAHRRHDRRPRVAGSAQGDHGRLPQHPHRLLPRPVRRRDRPARPRHPRRTAVATRAPHGARHPPRPALRDPRHR